MIIYLSLKQWLFTYPLSYDSLHDFSFLFDIASNLPPRLPDKSWQGSRLHRWLFAFYLITSWKTKMKRLCHVWTNQRVIGFLVLLMFYQIFYVVFRQKMEFWGANWFLTTVCCCLLLHENLMRSFYLRSLCVSAYWCCLWLISFSSFFYIHFPALVFFLLWLSDSEPTILSSGVRTTGRRGGVCNCTNATCKWS